MAKRVFNFQGTNKGKFMIAGANYVRKPLHLNKDTITLISYVEANFAEVCENSLTKGFCNGQCKSCPIQGAHDQTLIALASKPQVINVVNNYHINNCRNVFISSEPCAKDRGIRREDALK